jgi:hypothetical protein
MTQLANRDRVLPEFAAQLKEIAQDGPAIYAENDSAYYPTIQAENDSDNGYAAIFAGNVDVAGNLNIDDGSLTVSKIDVLVAIGQLQQQAANAAGLQAQINEINLVAAGLQEQIDGIQRLIAILQG